MRWYLIARHPLISVDVVELARVVRTPMVYHLPAMLELSADERLLGPYEHLLRPGGGMVSVSDYADIYGVGHGDRGWKRMLAKHSDLENKIFNIVAAELLRQTGIEWQVDRGTFRMGTTAENSRAWVEDVGLPWALQREWSPFWDTVTLKKIRTEYRPEDLQEEGGEHSVREVLSDVYLDVALLDLRGEGKWKEAMRLVSDGFRACDFHYRSSIDALLTTVEDRDEKEREAVKALFSSEAPLPTPGMMPVQSPWSWGGARKVYDEMLAGSVPRRAFTLEEVRDILTNKTYVHAPFKGNKRVRITGSF